MIRSFCFKGGSICVCLWILFQLYIVCECRRYDKCVTRDGSQGVCVVKRYCREANNQALLPCDGDAEDHCCPIPTTQRSAVPQPIPERPEIYRPGNDDKAKHHPDTPREPDRDDRLNKTPPPGDRRSPTRHVSEPPKKQPARDETDEYGNSPSRPVRYPEKVPSERNRSPTRHVSESSKKQPARDETDEYGNSPSRPVRYPEKVPSERNRSPTRHVNEPPKKQPARDETDEYGNSPNRPVRYPEKVPSDRNRDVGQTRTSARPIYDDRRDSPSRRPDNDRIYPARDELTTERPRRVNPSKHRNDDDSLKAPIRFPEPYEFSVPSPKVPACGVKPYELFIAGGEESEKHEWPWMTAIFRRHPDSRPKTFLCGGSLINTKYVLTAAHCFVNNYVILPASSFVVRVGSHFLDSGEEYTVANLVVHHNHSGSDFFNDIALVRLASEVYITDKVAPICLPDPIMIRDNLVGRMATVAGWGDTSFRTGHTRILQHVTVPIVSGEECFAAYSRVKGAAFLARGSDHVICAGLREGGKDACLGDSGGPLMLKMPDDRWIIVGIVSLGYKCAEPGYPGVYTRVTHYMSWINTNMKRH